MVYGLFVKDSLLWWTNNPKTLFIIIVLKPLKPQNFTIKLSNHPLKVNQIKQLPVGTILSFYYFGKTVHLRFCSSAIKKFSHQNIWLASKISLWKICEPPLSFLFIYFVLVTLFMKEHACTSHFICCELNIVLKKITPIYVLLI